MARIELNLDSIVQRLQQDRENADLTSFIQPAELIALSRMAQAVFAEQPAFLELNPPLCVCGDIHAQFTDLLTIFDQLGAPPITNYLFLGDYVDRGPANLETVVLLLTYKILHRGNFFLLRGNHETKSTNAVYGFKDEIKRRCGDDWRDVWTAFNEAFAYMPLTALIGGRILCMHGGLSPQLQRREQLRTIPRGWLDAGLETLEMDLIWSDPNSSIIGWRPNERGCSYEFGDNVIYESIRRLDLDLIVRAHQVVQDGYEMSQTKKLITLFSAPNYCGEFNNAGAVMYVDQTLGCSFVQFPPGRRPHQFINPRGPSFRFNP